MVCVYEREREREKETIGERDMVMLTGEEIERKREKLIECVRERA